MVEWWIPFALQLSIHPFVFLVALEVGLVFVIVGQTQRLLTQEFCSDLVGIFATEFFSGISEHQTCLCWDLPVNLV